ncbi:glutathione S-transferase family protein [Roseivivax sp.]
MSGLLLYGHPDSGHACKVALALRLAGLEHETRRIEIWEPRETRPEAFLAASPAGEVPCLMIDGAPHVQSGAILLEIASRFGVLGGTDPDMMRRAREVLFWEANRIGMCLPQLIEARRPGGDHFPPGALDWLEGRYATDRVRFELMLGAGPFFHGETPGIADCAVWGYVQWVEKAGQSPSPAMAGWIARMAALPGMAPPEDLFPR